MLRGKVEGEMAPLSGGSSVKESPEDKQASAPVSGEALMWGAHIFCKIRAGSRIFRRVRIFFYTGQDAPQETRFLRSSRRPFLWWKYFIFH